MPDNQPIHYLSLSEVAARFGLALGTLKGYIARGYLPPPDATIGTTRGWSPETIEAWLASRPGTGKRTDLQ